jgi:DNA polymerase-3 subunit delta
MLIQVEKALANTVILLSGEEEYPRRKSLKALLQILEADGGDFDLQAFDADASSPMDWLGAVSTSPFLSQRRTVVLRHLLRLGSPEEVFGSKCSSLSSIPPTGLLILVADDEQGDDSKQRTIKSRRTSWENAISKAKGFVYTYKVDAKSIQGHVKSEVETRGLKITPKALELLVEMTGGSLSRALDEIDKLALFCSDGNIRENDVSQAVMPAREWNVFKMADAIFSQNLATAVTQLRILVGSSPKPEEIAFQQIIPQLMSQLRLLWQARLCLDRKVNPSSAPPDLQALFLEKPNFSKEADWKQQKIIRTARNVDLPALARCFRHIENADASLKGLLPGYSPTETLEQMVISMTQEIHTTRR